jgi:GTPase SAR1 family protein
MSVRGGSSGVVSSTTGENMNISECTVVLLGDSGVGKTALVNRFVFNTFRQVLFLVYISMISILKTGTRDGAESFVDKHTM